MTSVITRILYFHTRIDYIFTRTNTGHTTSIDSYLLPFGIVVEPSSVQGLAADCLL
nr:MAG TPA: hypothetical protein [Caudoviricetes sp.]